MAYEVLKGAIAASGDKQDIPAVQDGSIANRMSFALGFPAITSEDKNLGGLPPRRADINQAFYLLSNNLYEFQNGAFPTFNASALSYLPGGVGYPNGAILWCAAEGRFVRSTKADNADNFITTPTYIGTSWVFLNDNEVSDDAVGLLLSNSTTNITVGTGFVKSSTTGRILKLSSSLSVLWSTIQTNSSVTSAANTRYNLFLAYNPTNTTYTILCAAYGSFTPTLPTGYTDYALIGYMSTDNNSAVNNVFPQEMDLQQWYRSGTVNNDKLTRFSVNSGNVDSDGNGDLISVSGSVVTFKVGGTYPSIVCTPANQLVSFTLSTINNFNTSTLADGAYALCVSKSGIVTAHPYIAGTLTYFSQKEPSTPSAGQLWCDTSKEPLIAYQYNSGWIPFYGVPLVVVTVASGAVVSYYTLSFNAKNLDFGTFTPLDTLIAEGTAAIAGTYTLTDLPDDGRVRFCAFECYIHLNSDNISIMSLSSDVFTNASNVCGTNNSHTSTTTVWIPVKRQITISFPATYGGVISPTHVRFKGYM